jgi:hypothetical protein
MSVTARVFLTVFLLALVACSQNTATTQSTLDAEASGWLATNPGGGGAFNSPVITKSGYWAVGSDLSGVYLSKNKGVSWSIIGSARKLTETHVASLLALPGGNLIIGSGNGIFTGLEDGAGLKKTYQDGYISALAASANPNVVYAAYHPQYNALSPKLLRSDDAGESWRVVSTTLPSNLRVVGLRTHPVDEDAVVVLAGEGRFNTGPAEAWLSGNSGTSWYRIAANVGEVMDVAYGVDGTNLNRMYLTTIRNNNTGFLYRSEDAGGNWTKIANHTGVILLDSVSPSRLRLQEFQVQHSNGTWEPNITTGMWESSNGGSTWQFFDSKAGFTPGWSNAHNVWPMGSGFQGYVQTLGNNVATPNTVLWTDSQFVRASTDGGRTWRDTVSTKVGTAWKSRGVDNAVPAVIAPSQADANLIYAGYFDMGLWRSDDGGASWTSLNDSRFSGGWSTAVGGNTLTVVPDPARANVVWAQLTGNLDDPKYLVKSTQRGNPGTWVKLTSGLPATMQMLEGLSVNANSSSTNRTLYVAAENDVYRSTNDGSSWSKVFDCNFCRLTYVVGGLVYAGGGSGLWKSTTGNLNTWTKLALPITGWTSNLTPRDWGFVGLVDVAMNGSTLWAAVLGKGFYRSTNSGTAWTLVRSDVFARTVAIDSAASEVYVGGSSALYAGGYDARSKGVLVSGNNGATWRNMNTGLGYPFATMIRLSGTAKWVLSPGQGVLKWQ